MQADFVLEGYKRPQPIFKNENGLFNIFTFKRTNKDESVYYTCQYKELCPATCTMLTNGLYRQYNKHEYGLL